MRRNIALEKIKLIIWDLDDTLWNGTFAEGQVDVKDDYFALIKKLNTRGIVSSICSKNDEAPVLAFLFKIGAKEDFVFPSINYESKAPRIKEIISKMNLREENCLFIDDNFRNLEEAISLMPKLMISTPEIANCLIDCCSSLGKNDTALSRLNQYKTLEKKVVAREAYYDEASFLASSDIKICFCELTNEQLVARAIELNKRAHQLNYTKMPLTAEELASLMANGLECRLIQCDDKYGDYGYIGFYAFDPVNSALLHFCFSCRTLGMHIEQFVYEHLGFPVIKTIEPVTIGLKQNGHINYISIVEPCVAGEEKAENSDILLIGPCDLETVDFFLPWNPVTEFRHYDESNRLIAYGSHPLVLENVLNKVIYTKTAFFNPVVNGTNIFSGKYKLVIYSYITALLYGEYRNKSTGERILFGEWPFDATSENDDLNAHNIGFSIKDDDAKEFRENYEFLGRATPEEQASRIVRIVDSLLKKETHVCLILASEKKYSGEKQLSLLGGEKYGKAINEILAARYEGNDKIFLVNPSQFIKSRKDYAGSIQHYARNVYKLMADTIVAHYPEFQRTPVNKKTPELLLKADNKNPPFKRAINKLKKTFAIKMPRNNNP